MPQILVKSGLKPDELIIDPIFGRYSRPFGFDSGIKLGRT